MLSLMCLMETLIDENSSRTSPPKIPEASAAKFENANELQDLG